MRSNPVIALLALFAAIFLIKLTWGIILESRGDTQIQYAAAFIGLVVVFKMIGFLTFWAIVSAMIAFPLALFAYFGLKPDKPNMPES